MADLAPASPLMALVHYHGQDYYTAQYFHRQYLANSQYGGKHQRFDSFMRLLRAIPAYQDHVTLHDIQEVRWGAIKLDEPHLCGSFKGIFEVIGWNPLTLLNATAQIAMVHHLDDELSRKLSVAVNTKAARQHSSRAGAGEIEQRAANALRGMLDAASILGTPLYVAQQEAVKYVDAKHGVDFRPLMLHAPAQDNIPDNDVMLEPTDLAKALNVASGRDMNLWLQSWGWQIRNIADGWAPTPAGMPFCSRHAWTRGNKTGFNLKWKRRAVEAMLRQHASGGAAMKRRTDQQIPLFDLAAHDDAQHAYLEQRWMTDAHAALKADFARLCTEYTALQLVHKALYEDHGVLLAAISRITKERDLLAAQMRTLRSENQSLRFQMLLQQARTTAPVPDIDALLRDLLKASHPDRWSQGQAATELAHEMAVALNAARERYHDA